MSITVPGVSTIESFLQLFYIGSAASILFVVLLPPLRDRFLDYGARADQQNAHKHEQNGYEKLLNSLASITVPHRWFFHFYFVSLCCTIFWLDQILRNGLLFQVLARRPVLEFPTTAFDQRLLICMFLMLLQGLRRLYECFYLSKSSKSRMWIGHYFIGLAFYLTINVAIWIQAVSNDVAEKKSQSTSNGAFTLLDWSRIVLSITAFACFSIGQNRVHAYLASLTKYTVPDHPLFTVTKLVAPHYFFEVGIYSAFSVLTASNDKIVNSTMFMAVIFVMANLGVTAHGTRQWLLRKFPDRSTEIRSRYQLIPFVW